MIRAFCGKIGGVGKSIGAATCVEWLATRGEFAVVEADVNNNVGSYSEGVAKKVWRVNLLAKSGWLDLSTALAEETAPEIVLSLPAGADTVGHATILRDVLADTQRTMVVFWMMNRTPESVALLSKAMTAFADSRVHLVAVRNLFFGEAQKFAIWNNSNVRKAFVKAAGTEVDFPELDDMVIEATFGAPTKVRFSAATGLSYGHRWELRRWLEATAAMYEDIDDKFGQKSQAQPVSA